MRIQKCKDADRYKVLDEPRCGCETCWTKWDAKQRALAARKRRRMAR